MENTSINLGTILEQARDWTFDGDFQILQWMNKLSEDLEARASTTTENLDRLNNNVKSTHVALDNVANSLTALQYGNQFVECRVQDDDETSMSGGNEGIIPNGIATSAKPSSKEILTTFLDNNLKLLRNCHEKYSIDLDDSDEEDDKAEKTYIFQPINPYNEKPLPHIFGSKEWCEKWHVGLSYDDQDNNYSGDEISEAYSESSSCSAAPDNDSYETNSEFASSISLNNDNLASSNLERNVSKFKKSKVETVSETSSTNSSAAKLSIHHPQSHDLIEEMHAASSSLSSSQSKTEDSFTKLKDSSAATNDRKTITSVANIPPYVDLFAEPPEDFGSTSSTPSLVDHILHKPVNIFNDEVDDVFKHLVIAQSKRSDPPVPRERTNVKAKSYPVEQTSTTPKTNASDESKVTQSEQPKYNVGEESHVRVGTNSRTPKSLFDDDDEDEDFLSAFVKRQKSYGSPKLLENPSEFPKMVSNNRNEEDIFKDIKEDAKTKTPNEIIGNENRNMQNAIINLFDDVEDEPLDFVTQKPSNIMQTSTKVTETSPDTRENDNIPTRSLANIMRSTNLFDDDEDDDDDFFRTLPSIRSSVPSQIVNKDESKPSSEMENDLCKTVPSIDLSITNQTEKEDKIIKSSSLVVQTDGLYKHTPDIDTVSDSLKTSFGSSGPSQVMDNSKVKISSGVLNESLKDDDDDDFFENLKSILPSIPTQTVDNIEDKRLPKKSNDIEAQNTIHNLFDGTDKQNVLAPKSSVILRNHPDSETQKEDLAAFSESSAVESKNIFEDENNTAIAETTKTVENVHEDVKTAIDLDTKSDDCFTQETKEQEILYTTEDILKNQKSQEPLLNKGSKDKQNKIYTAKAGSGTNSDSEDQNIKKHLMPNVGSTTEQINIGESLNFVTEKKSATLTTEPLNVSVPTMSQNTNEPSKEQLNKTGADLYFSKDDMSQKYDLNSSFLFDEPPDDDDDDNNFFDSLEKTSHKSITKYNSFDLENDLYPEPDLPNIPSAEVSSSTYAGLQLFDDNPPEDDGFHEVKTRKPETAKRLNTVFYDDFHETLEALNVNQEQKTISTHSILNNEPPPDMDDDKAKFGIQNKDVVDFLKPDIKDGVNSESSTNTKNVDAHKKPDLREDEISKPYNKNPISKLRLPNININVETLLPFGGGIPPRLKMTQNEKKNLEIENNVSTPIVSNESSAPGTLETSHILPNINKTRVRAPLNRKPSTRKARQENYRKSLLEDELLSKDDDKHQENNKSNSKVQQEPKLESKLQIHKTNENSSTEFIEPLKPLNTTHPSSKSHHIIDNVNAQPSTSLKSTNVSPNTISDKNTLSLLIDKEELHNTSEQMSNKKTILTKNPKLFDEQEDDGNGKDIVKVITSKKSINNSKENVVSLQNDLSNQLNSDTTRHLSGFNETPQRLLKSQLINNNIGAGHLPQNITKEKYKTPLLDVSKTPSELKSNTKMLFTDSESDDDLFSKFSSTKPKAIEPPKRVKSNTVAAGKSLETRKAPMNKPQASLFSDDSDEDDDFLKTTDRTKVVSKNKTKVAPPTKSIFSDIEDSDDGDLFGGNSKVINKLTVNTIQSTAAEVKQSNIQTIADNPLSDLL